MKSKYLLILPIVMGTCQLSNAQNSDGSSVQTASMEMAEIVSANFFSSGNGGNGGTPDVVIPIGGTDALDNGIESPEIEVSLQCTADYDISVAASSENFSYTGSENANTTMAVKDVLSIVITSNNTGGTIGNGLSQYQPINGTTNKLAISSGLRGVRTFKFKYKAQPGFNYPAGTYSTDIVYTLSKK